MNGQVKLAYAAGIVDGEGCFSINKNRNTFVTSLGVKMNDRTVTRWLQAEFGGNIVSKASQLGQEASYNWHITTREQVQEVTEALLPYLKAKRLPAIIVLEFCTRFSKSTGKAHSEETRTEMAKYSEFMAVANGTGPGSTTRKEQFLQLLVGGAVT